MNHCSNCGEPIHAKRSELPEPGEVDKDYDKPVQGGGDRVYCNLSCAREKQGW